MKTKHLTPAKLIIISGLVLTIIVNTVFCIAKKPTVTEHSFPFSVTYELDGQLHTIEDEFICTYTGAGESVNPRDRFYDGYCANANEEIACGEYLIQTYEDGELVLLTKFFAGYMMGDPLYADHYTDYYRFEPHIAFYKYDDYMEYTEEEILAPYHVKLVDWDYPEPIENNFVFSHLTRLTPSGSLAMLAASLLTLLACIIFVKKDRSLTFGTIHKISFILHFVVGFVVLPFLSIVCPLADINGNGADPISQVTYCVPAITAFGLAISICLRRKGYGKASVLAQFTGVAVMALLLLTEALLHIMM